MPGVARASALPHGAVFAIAAAIAAVLGWRAIAAGVDALRAHGYATDRERAPVAGVAVPEAALRARLARDPTDVAALLALGGELERSGRRADAEAAVRAAAALAPADPQVLIQFAGFLLRGGDDAQALAALARAADAGRGELPDVVVRAFIAALDSGRHAAYFDRLAHANPPWWPAFFREACARARSSGALAAALGARAATSVATAGEWRCAIARLQREGHWARAHQLWLNSLAPAARERIGHVFNGGFEAAPTNTGFDWIVAARDGVAVAAEPAPGASGARALAVSYASVRYTGPPIAQHLMLAAGRHRLDGRGRAELDAAFALQWIVVCEADAPSSRRTLARAAPFTGHGGWTPFSAEFVVPADCPVQRLELALAGVAPGAASDVAAKLTGTVRFDDLAIRFLD